jgi:hypothetical protein
MPNRILKHQSVKGTVKESLSYMIGGPDLLTLSYWAPRNDFLSKVIDLWTQTGKP